MTELKIYKGTLKKEFLNKGSKSEHEGVVLTTADGASFEVRVVEGNPFHDPILHAYAGKYVEVEGRAGASGLLMVPKYQNIAVMKPPKA